MNKQAVHHETKSRYSYIYEEGKLHLRFRTAKNDVDKVIVKTFDPYEVWVQESENSDNWVFSETKITSLSMEKEHTNDLYDFWFAELESSTLRMRYGFIMETDEDKYFYGSKGICDNEAYEKKRTDYTEYFNFPFINKEDIFTAPKWVESTVWYQIFVDRFCNGSPDDGRDIQPWEPVEKYNDQHFGGNIKGIISKLDYLEEMGINGIYFTPLFVADSAHHYDTIDYYTIDPFFGSNQEFGELVEEAHKRGIKIVLDAVFNHCSWKHPFWQDVLEKGVDSEYYDYFHILDPNKAIMDFSEEDVINYNISNEDLLNMNYRTFALEPKMPKWNHSNPEVREYLFDVAKFWVETYDIDGWRLDVSNEVPHEFWREFRQIVKKSKADAYIVGENWEGYYPWIQGDQFDSVMNYELMFMIWNFIGKKGEYIKNEIKVEEFKNQLGDFLVAYPKNTMPYMFNVIDSHDTARVINIADFDLRRAKLLYLLQMIMPGSPSIYYGSEIGLKGFYANNRELMDWDNDPREHELYKYLSDLISKRKTHPSMQVNSFKWIDIDQANNSFILKKESISEDLYIFMNNSDDSVKFTNPLTKEEFELGAFEYEMIFDEKKV